MIRGNKGNKVSGVNPVNDPASNPASIPASNPPADAAERPAPTRRVVLGITGSIAAYKAAELVRLFRKSGFEVRVIMTRSATEFITPLTLGTLSGQPVTTEMFRDTTGGPYLQWGQSGEASEADGSGNPPEGGIRHIQVSRESDLIVVAPASGNILGKVAHGIADDSLSTAIMASSAPVLFAPAMNTRMWLNPAVQDNVALLRRRGYHFVQPGSGDLACGETGEGRMAEPEEIFGAVWRLFSSASGKPRLLVTTGRTEEPIDPVRVLTNRSSGRMGFAVAQAGRDLGYGVTVVAGATSVPPPPGCEVVRVQTAREMAAEVGRREKEFEILVMAAAVADYAPRKAAAAKIPGGQNSLTLELAPVTDILASLRAGRRHKVTVGFALETEGGLDRARAKLARKGCDFLVYNNPTAAGSHFGSETNRVTFVYPDGRAEAMPLLSKVEVGFEILKRAQAILDDIGRKPRAGSARSGRPAGR